MGRDADRSTSERPLPIGARPFTDRRDSTWKESLLDDRSEVR